MMASMMAMPQKGHLDQLYHIFSYLKWKHNSEIVFDPTLLVIDIRINSQNKIGIIQCIKIRVRISLKMHLNREDLVLLWWLFVDSDHAGDHITRRSRTGFFIKLNNSPIYLIPKKQSGIEISTFGSEFMALKCYCEYVWDLRYKFRMMGIQINGPTYIFGHNKAVLVNLAVLDSVLKKKSNSIIYHFIREGTASDEWRTTYVQSKNNIADMLTHWCQKETEVPWDDFASFILDANRESKRSFNLQTSFEYSFLFMTTDFLYLFQKYHWYYVRT